VQTIHALCTRLLQQFPFEANVPARFAVLDERDQNEMMERANLKVLLDASRDPDSAGGRALNVAMASAADVTFKDVVREACLSRDHFMAWTDSAGSVEAAAAQMSAALGVDPATHRGGRARDRRRAASAEIAVERCRRDSRRWRQVRAGPRGSASRGARIDRRRASRRISRHIPYRRAHTPQDGGDEEIRRQQCGRRKPVRAGGPAHRTSDRAAPRGHGSRPDASAAGDRNRGGCELPAREAERGLLDYDDLIDKTLEMLDRVSSGWVHYKLDRGVDHVLIDEAQDTSPRQWDIVAHIISEFTSGEGARDGVTRTIFASATRSSRSFRFRARPRANSIAAAGGWRRSLSDAGLKFDPVSFTYSFRSGPAILQSVDHVFREETIYRSIHSAESGYPIHDYLADAGPS